MKTSACLLALVAGAAFASVASAQALEQGIPITREGVRTLLADGTMLPGGYSQRLTANVFEYNQAGPFVFFGPYAGTYDDVRYPVILGATPDVDLEELELFVALNANNTETGCRIVIEIYDTHTAGVFPPYTSLLHTQTYTFPVGTFPANNAAVAGYDVVLGGWPTINTGDNTVSIFVRFLNFDGTAIHPSLRQVFVTNSPITTGTSLGGCYIDLDNNGIIETADGGPYVAGGTTAMHACYILTGDVPVDPPAGAIDIGTLTACAPSTTAVSLAASEIKWYKFTVPAGGVVAANLNALTIDTETPGSSDDSVIGLYAANGNLILVDDDDASGALSQATFGIGRWNGPGDGLPYDGRNGNLPAGDYYLAVTSFGAGLFFEDGFIISPGASPAASYNLNINLYDQNCLPNLDAPIPDVDLGTLVGPSFFPDTLDMTTGIRWYKFTTCIDIADPANYLDFDFSPSNGDLVAVIFDINGNEVAFSDDADAVPGDGIAYLQPQFSFGNTTERFAGGQGIGSLPLAGQDGTLPAGEYYMAVGGFPYALLPEATSTTNGRFFFFGSALETGLVSPFITTDVTQDDCDNANPCPPCAADYDNNGGVDGGDLGAFFADFEAGELCADVDGNGGVDGGDLGFFFEVFEQGGC